jgi:hypothetical protein
MDPVDGAAAPLPAAAAPVAPVAVVYRTKLSAFWPSNPASWFATTEGKFFLDGIVDESFITLSSYTAIHTQQLLLRKYMPSLVGENYISQTDCSKPEWTIPTSDELHQPQMDCINLS